MCALLSEQLHRLTLIKVQHASVPYLLTSPSQAAQQKALDSKEQDEAGTADFSLDLGASKVVMFWNCQHHLSALELYRTTKFTDASFSLPYLQTLDQLVQVYLLFRETVRLTTATGGIMNDRSHEAVRLLIQQVKKDTMNFGSPAPLDKVHSYFTRLWAVQRLRLASSVYSSAYSLLATPHHEPNVTTVIGLARLYEQLILYPKSPHASIHVRKADGEARILAPNMSQLSLAERKTVRERFSEVFFFFFKY
jgi:hypothetical protein